MSYLQKDGVSPSNCTHALRIGSLCAVCGAEISREDGLLPALHRSDKLVLTKEEAHKIHTKKNRKLKKDGKMILVLDLDQTILHSSLQRSECDFQFAISSMNFYVKLRPFFLKFLKKIHRLFEIHIYTMGTREYAEEICRRIDPMGVYFKDRIVSRSENFNELKKTLDRITSIHSNVVILDDRADVWEFCNNLVLIKPFYYYNEIDINDPFKTCFYYLNSTGDERADSKNKVEDFSVGLLGRTNEEEHPVLDAITETANDDSQISGDVVLDPMTGCDGMDGCNLDPEPLVFEVANEDTENTKKNEPEPRIFQMMPASTATLPKYKDRELVKVLKTLKKVHANYFRTNKEVSRLLRIKTMKRIRIYAGREYEHLVRFSGAEHCTSNPSIVIQDRVVAERFKVLNVSVKWLYTCIYERRAVETVPFVISDHRINEDMRNAGMFALDEVDRYLSDE